MDKKSGIQLNFSKYDIPVRHPKFNYAKYLKYLDYKEVVKSILPTSLSLCFPAGEGWFINSIKNFENEISDPELLKNIKRFCGQETAHTAAHKIYNEMLKNHGIINDKGYCTLDIVDRKITSLKEKQKKSRNQRLVKRRMLALTVGAEHLIALFAEQALKNPAYLNAVETGICDLLRWHAAEEIEHKAVAFDVYKAVGGRYSERVMVLLLFTFIIGVYTAKCCLILLKKNKFLFNLKAIAIFLRHNFYKPGIFTRAIPEYFSFFRLDFHPWNHDNYYLIKRWKIEYPEIDQAY